MVEFRRNFKTGAVETWKNGKKIGEIKETVNPPGSPQNIKKKTKAKKKGNK